MANSYFKRYSSKTLPATEEEAPQEVRKTRLTAELDPNVSQMIDNGLNPKHHPGKRAPKCVALPAFLERSALNIIKSESFAIAVR